MDETPPGLTLSSLRINDPEAWQVCFNWLSPMAKKVARLQLLGYPEPDVEEVASDAMQLVVERIRDSDDLSGLREWVCMVAKRRAIDHRRKFTAAKRDRTMEQSLEVELENNGGASLPHEVDQADQQEARREQRDLLDAAVKQLKPPFDALLIGFFVEQLSYKELAERHGLSINTIGSYLRRGINKLRSILERQPAFQSLQMLLQLPFLLLNHFLPHP